MSAPDPDPLAARAVAGDALALDQLCRELQQPVYRLALRMFSNPQDAADVTQEALIRIVTSVDFDELSGEVRIACTYGMLLCLSRPVRLAYLLGDVVGFTDIEGAQACDLSPAAFRQRLARARRSMRSVLAGRCGLVGSANPCRCGQLVDASIAAGILDQARPHFARHPGTNGAIPHQPIAPDTVSSAADELDVAVAIGEVYRSDPAFHAPAEVMERMATALPILISE